MNPFSFFIGIGLRMAKAFIGKFDDVIEEEIESKEREITIYIRDGKLTGKISVDVKDVLPTEKKSG